MWLSNVIYISDNTSRYHSPSPLDLLPLEQGWSSFTVCLTRLKFLFIILILFMYSFLKNEVTTSYFDRLYFFFVYKFTSVFCFYTYNTPVPRWVPSFERKSPLLVLSSGPFSIQYTYINNSISFVLSDYLSHSMYDMRAIKESSIRQKVPFYSVTIVLCNR